MVPDAPKNLPEGVKMVPDAPKNLPEGVKMVPDAPKNLPEGLKMMPDAPKNLRAAPGPEKRVSNRLETRSGSSQTRLPAPPPAAAEGRRRGRCQTACLGNFPGESDPHLYFICRFFLFFLCLPFLNRKLEK